MDRWSGTLKVPLHANGRARYNVAASLCLSPTSRSLSVPSANALFFSGDRVSGTGNPVIERLSNLQNIAEILVSKLGCGCVGVNAWVIEASVFNGPFAVYKDFIPCVNQWGESKSYDPTGFPASGSTVALLSNCLQQVKNVISQTQKELSRASVSASRSHQQTPKTLVFGFSKGGTVVNQLVTELGFSNPQHQTEQQQQQQQQQNDSIVPETGQALLNSIAEVHYVDVGLNSAGAYVTDEDTFERISRLVEQHEGREMRFVLHGTPRQWCDERRPWIRGEKDRMLSLLRSRARASEGRLEVSERLYFADSAPPDLQMHFEAIEKMDLS